MHESPIEATNPAEGEDLPADGAAQATVVHRPLEPTASIDPLFLTAPRVSTFLGGVGLTNASGLFFHRDERLYLATSRHVLIDVPSGHRPDRLEIELHMDPINLTRSTGFSMLLYARGRAVWRQGRDSGGAIDVAVIELDRARLPAGVVYRAFTPAHLVRSFADVPTSEPLRVVGFPLGFHDTRHHLPVLRHAVFASPYGIRFQGQGYFLTDARTHRGTSGAPVVVRDAAPSTDTADLPWKLLGVHSSRMDIVNRDLVLDESLGLNCAWYADILLTLTDPANAAPPS